MRYTVGLIDPETHRSYTYAQVRDASIEFGKGLKAHWNWKRGDVLAMYTPNSIDYPPVIWGCFWAGGVISPANPAYTVNELAYQLKDSGAKALVTQLPNLKTALEACQKVGIPPKKIILLGARDPQRKFRHFTDVRNTSHSAKYGRTRVNPRKDLAFLSYSSGTTGLPKGVRLSHRNVIANVLQIAEGEEGNLKWMNGDRSIAVLPFFHIYVRSVLSRSTRKKKKEKDANTNQGLSCLLHFNLHFGIPLIVMSSFNLAAFLQNIQTYRITFAYVVPPIVLLLFKSPLVSQYDLSSLRMVSSGGAPLTASLIQATSARIKAPIKQGYGLSETSPTTHTQRWSDWNQTYGSVGPLLSNQQAKYMSETEIEVPVGQTGELWLKGPNIFLGYHNDPISTSRALTPDGWFKTGDIGYQDPRGNFYITDRVKELIKYKGFQVPPAELEGLLLSMEDTILDVAVTGVWDEDRHSEVPVAWVVVKEGVQRDGDTEGRIVNWCEQRVAGHKRLRGGVRFVDEVPRSASGKILRRVLRDRVSVEEGRKRRGAKL